MSEILKDLATAVIEGDLGETIDLTEEALDDDIGAEEILNEGLMPGMDYVGVEFKAGNMFVPEVLRSARAMQGAMAILRPLLVESGAPMAGKVLLGTVKGDLHDIGKNLVGMMMESGGMTVVNMGVDISSDKFAEAVREHKPDIVAMSALLTTTMLAMKDTIEVLKEEGLRDSVQVIVGGAPVTADFADEIGADGWAPDAASAKDLAIELAAKK